MEKLDYYVLDVFTGQRYKGNQLAVVYIENELTIEQYHDISREFGYSETSFVLFFRKAGLLDSRLSKLASTDCRKIWIGGLNEILAIGAGGSLVRAKFFCMVKRSRTILSVKDTLQMFEEKNGQVPQGHRELEIGDCRHRP
jgi:hypothetical protein